jgi:beta-galactosidase
MGRDLPAGTLEARGFKHGRQVMVARRETVGNAANLAIRTDRAVILANGEDVVFCTVEVRDAQGRVLPITSQEVLGTA